MLDYNDKLGFNKGFRLPPRGSWPVGPEGVLTLILCFSLLLSSENLKANVKTPSDPAKTRRRATSDVTTSRFAQIRETLIWRPDRLAREALKAQTKIVEYQQIVFCHYHATPHLSFLHPKEIGVCAFV